MGKRGPKPKAEREKKETEKEVKQALPSMTPEERAIAERVLRDSVDDWDTITEADMEDFSLSENPFKLPESCQKMVDEKRFKFRWAERDPKRIDFLRDLKPPRQWKVANLINCSFLKKGDVDPVVGAICRYDQILMVQPYAMFEKYQEILANMADQQTRQGEVHKRNGIKDPEKGVEYMAGPEHKIGSQDEVVEDVEEFDHDMGLDEGGSGLDDIVDESEE